MEHTPVHWLNARRNQLQNWESAKPGRYRKAYVICFTSIFLLTAFICLLSFFIYGRSLIWSIDGLYQYFPLFVYEGEWIRNLIGGLVSGQGWNPELWSWSLGYGSDVLGTLDVFWNPLNLISALAPAHYAEYLFQFVLVLRLWLAGITFSWYALYRGNGRFAVLCGALLYSLCISSIIVTFWPAGTDGLILFPLLLLGVEKVLDGKRPTTFILAVAALFFVCYYFAYAAFILVVPYAIVRLYLLSKTRPNLTLRRALITIAAFFLYGIVGVALSAVALVPSVIALFGAERATEVLVQVPLLYGVPYYESTIAGFLGSATIGSDCIMGFGGVAFVCCVVVFMSKKGATPLKWAFAVLTLFLLLPCFGSMFNGFNYATNRWVWAYALCVSYMVVYAVPLLWSLTAKQRRTLTVATIVYAAIIFVMPLARTEKTLAALAVTIVVLALIFTLRNSSTTTRRYALCAVLCAGLAVNVFYYASTSEEDGIAIENIELGKGYQRLIPDSANSVVTAVDDPSWWRYDGNPAPDYSNKESWVRLRNNSVVQHLKGIDFYYSIYNSNVDAFHTELGIAGDQINFSYDNLGGRAMLEVLAGVKYYANPANGTDTPAYNYNNPANIVASGSSRGKQVDVYRGSNTLPLGFTYSSVIPRSTYEALTPLQKQEALMQGVVISDEDSASLPVAECNPSFTQQKADYTIESSSGLYFKDDGSFVVTDKNATMTLAVSGLPACETYLYFSNLEGTPLSKFDTLSEEARSNMPLFSRVANMLRSVHHKSSCDYFVFAQADNGSTNRRIENYANTYHMYGGKNDWALNLGYSDKAQTKITLSFNVPGAYSYDDLQVICQPMSSFDEQVNALKQDVLENVNVSNNLVEGTIQLDTPKCLYLSIPYSQGWSVTVDGAAVEPLKANTAFMAIPLEAGTHDIRLEFMTPGLALGAAISVIGLIAFGFVLLVYRKTHR